MSGAQELVGTDGTTAGTLNDGTAEPAGHSPRPYLHPVLTPGGRTVSGYQPPDHAWHLGLSITISTIDVPGQDHPVNLWGGPTYVRGEGYLQLPNNGSQRELARTIEADGVAQQLSWHAADGEQFLTEQRIWSARSVIAGGAQWLCTTVHSSWRNTTEGPLVFGSPTTSGRPGAGYGGFFLRLSPDFDGAAIVAPADAVGAPSPEESEAMGVAGPWLALRSEEASVLMVAGVRNPREPAPWFVRTAGTPMLCAAPFFHEAYELAAGGVAEWSWSLLTMDGAADDDAIRATAEVLRTS